MFAVFLVSELQAAQIVASNSSSDKEAGKPTSPLQDLQIICKTLQLPEPGHQQISDLFTSIENQVSSLLLFQGCLRLEQISVVLIMNLKRI